MGMSWNTARRIARTFSRAALPAAWLLAGAAQAGEPRLQASMLVDGTIGITPQGAVLGYTLKHPEALPEAVKALLAQNIPHWRFEPVIRAGKPVAAKATMHVRVVASPVGEHGYKLGVGSTSFGDPNGDDQIAYAKRSTPVYPDRAVEDRVSGTAYLILEVDRRGRVEHAAAQQVDLSRSGSAYQLKMWRTLLEKASLRAARTWTFRFPHADQRDHWLVRVPVVYSLYQWGEKPTNEPRYGDWNAYVPGPVKRVSWLSRNTRANASVDAIPDGGAYLADQALHRAEEPSG